MTIARTTFVPITFLWEFLDASYAKIEGHSGGNKNSLLSNSNLIAAVIDQSLVKTIKCLIYCLKVHGGPYLKNTSYVQT
jgi:hypothetical protein